MQKTIGSTSAHGNAGRVGRVLAVVLALVATAALVAGCSDAGGDSAGGGDGGEGGSDTTVAPEQAKDPVPGGELVFGLMSESDSWNPAAATWSPASWNVARALYDPLTVIDEEGIARPYLVESIEPNEELTEWILKLRDDDITFHNGDPFTAEVLATHIKTMQLSALTSFAYDPVDAVAVLEPDNEDCGVPNGCVAVFTNEPWATFPAILSSQSGYVSHPGMQDGSLTDPVGTGPFVFDEWVRDDHLTVVRNDDYWRDGLPYLDKVTFRPLVDPASRMSALQAGDIDLFHTNDSAQLVSVGHDGSQVDDGLQVVFDNSSSDEMNILFDTQSGPTADPDVRRALALATDRAALNDGLYDGFFELADGPYREGELWWSDSGWPDPDPDEAASIIADWEAENGDLVIDYKFIPGNEGLKLGQAIQEQWAAVGVEVDIQQLETNEFAQALLTGNFDAVQIPFFNRSDPDEHFHYWDPDRIGEPGKLSLNLTRYTSDVQDRVLHEARQTTDVDTRKALYAELWADWAQNFPYVWLYHVQFMLVARDDIQGLDTFTYPDGSAAAPMDWGAVFLTDVWIDS